MTNVCILDEHIDFLSKRWNMLIILELMREEQRPKRYSEIKRALSPITPKILSSRLRELRELGIIEKYVHAESVPIRSEYGLTESGRDFLNVIDAVKEWTIRWKEPKAHCRKQSCLCCMSQGKQ
jgi:DNA-binding HxlR family transcriptional regulator